MRNRSDAMLNVALGVLSVCALVVTLALVRRELGWSGTPVVTTRETVREWRKFADARNVIGPADAPVTIVEFSDFQCPFCARLHGTLSAVRKRYPAEVRIVYRHLPLDNIHPHARKAAFGAECARRQGRFVQWHDGLYELQDSIGRASWDWFARRAGIEDSSAFHRCLDEPGVADVVAQDVRAAAELRAQGTPTVLVNEQLVRMAPDSALLDSLIANALAASARERPRSRAARRGP